MNDFIEEAEPNEKNILKLRREEIEKVAENIKSLSMTGIKRRNKV